jgi:sodium-dependent dicarboxylate transporter 2/3/5
METKGISKEKIGLILGPVLAAFLLIFIDLDPENPLVTRAAAVILLMAVWWITEAIPIPATALLPVFLFPALGILSGRETSAAYFNDVIFLFIGGFIMALAMQRWKLHKRIALKTILYMGTAEKKLLFGFMAATAIISMWVSNTATTMMVIPIVISIMAKLEEHSGSHKSAKLSKALLLGVAYAASIGGTATLIGTPPNLVFARVYSISFPEAAEITFVQWMKFGIPFSLCFLIITWWVLSRIYLKKGREIPEDPGLFKNEHRLLGKATYEEKVVFVAFVFLVFLWLTRNPLSLGVFTIPGWSQLLPQPGFVDDGTAAIAVSLILFLIPSKSVTNEKIMNWKTAVNLDWGVVLLFGGGFALAQAMESSGLSLWLGEKLHGLKDIPNILIVLSLCLILTFMSEIASNTAAAQMTLPLVAALAVAIEVHPLFLMVPATLAASSGFMMPVATPPNAIVFATGKLKMTDMVRAGLKINLIGAVLITLATYLLLEFAFGI